MSVQPVACIVQFCSAVPDPPRDLTFYRLNRTAIWLRWREPARPSGTLRAYVIEVTPLKGGSSHGPSRLMRSERLAVGSHCAAYPDQVCYTVTRLRPQSRYTVTVSAVNEHGDKPGETASVEASTIKGGELDLHCLKGIEVIAFEHNTVTFDSTRNVARVRNVMISLEGQESDISCMPPKSISTNVFKRMRRNSV